jgi:plasmid maintenance system antidote protein VapI
MTQAELAKLLDIEQGTVSKIMSGARSITLDHAKRCAVENAQNQPWQRLKLLTYCGSSDHAELDPYCG